MAAKALVSAAILAVALDLSCGCAGHTPKPTPVKATLVAAQDVNPDGEGHPAPIVVRVYELKDEGAFNTADYFRLVDHEQEVLGQSLVAREEYELQPGESRAWELKLPAEARFVGAAAGFRDLANSHWKALLPAPGKGFRTPRITVDIAKSAVSIKVGK